MPISETLLLPGFKTISDICRPSSSAVRHARTPASLTAAAMVLAENAPAFSSRPSVSSTKSDLLGHALRTSLACELAVRTGFSLRWNRSATPAGRSWWVLGTPARRTEGTEHGLLLPTPRTADGDRGGRGDLIRAICGNENKHFRNSLLPTPTAVNYGSNELRKCLFSLPQIARIRSPRPPRSPSAVRGVGSNNPCSVPSVRRAGVPSTHHERPAGVAERFQRSENPVSASSSDARDVL